MNKLKIYLDTSVISHLEAPDTPHKMQDTLNFWNNLENEIYVPFISEVTQEELLKCNEPKKSLMFGYLKSIKFETIQFNEEMVNLSQEILNKKILTEKSRDDCKHIASAIVSNCDIIASWNFKHLVNIKTINGVRELGRVPTNK